MSASISVSLEAPAVLGANEWAIRAAFAPDHAEIRKLFASFRGHIDF